MTECLEQECCTSREHALASFIDHHSLALSNVKSLHHSDKVRLVLGLVRIRSFCVGKHAEIEVDGARDVRPRMLFEHVPIWFERGIQDAEEFLGSRLNQFSKFVCADVA